MKVKCHNCTKQLGWEVWFDSIKNLRKHIKGKHFVWDGVIRVEHK